MSNEKKRIEAIYHLALEKKNKKERSSYLDSACGDDSKLRASVEGLLQAHDKAGDFLEVPPFDPDVTLDESPLAERPGTTIGNYKLLEQIGEGGMAVVYMAEQEKPLRRRVALKIIKLGMDTKSVIARFEVERQALAVMDHPNIAKVFDAGTTETGRPYFVMELVRGVSISKYCDKNKLDTKERLDLFVQVCNAVQHAHQKGIIHRDIKPSNVMVTLHDGKPVPKVIDFGIAKATSHRLTEKTVFTRYAQMIGTPAYMSPEQAEMSGLDVDTRTDIYSLGVLLYELLTAATPFSEEQLREAGYLEMQRIICEEEPLKPSTKLSTLGDTLTDVAEHRKASPDLLQKLVRGDLDWIVMKSLEKNRTRRYDTAVELSADITRHLSNEPVQAAAPTLLYKAHKFIRRHRIGVTASLLIVTALLIGVMGTTIGFIQARSQRRKALANFQTACDNLNQMYSLMYAAVDVGISEREQAQRLIKVLEYAENFFQSYLKESTDDPTMRHKLGLALKQRGEFNVICKEYREAELAYSKAVDLFEKLASDFPARDDLLREVVYATNAVGFTLELQGRQQEAEEAYRSSLALLKTLGNKFTFGVPTNLGPTVNSRFYDSSPCISYDGLSLYFHSTRPGGVSQNDLWVARRETPESEWSAPVNLGPQVNSPAWDGHPCISADGLSLFLQSLRNGGHGAEDIWVATRKTPDGDWSAAVNLGPPVNTPYREGHPCISSDGLSLFFKSNRPGGLGASDIWVTRRKSGSAPWSTPVNLGPTVNTESSDSYPSISSDGLMLFFGSTRSGGFGSKTDLWVAVRSSISEAWGMPMNLGPPVNSAGRETSPSISSDGRMLYFSTELWPANAGVGDLWQMPILKLPSEHRADTDRIAK